MSTQRLVDSCFWDDSYIVNLDPSEKLLFLYLLTNPLTNIAGVYEISLKRIAFDTGFTTETVETTLKRFERDGRCLYRDGWIAMRNWIKHQRQAPDTLKGIERRLAVAPEGLSEYAKTGRVPSTIVEGTPNSTKLNSTKLNLSDMPSPPAPAKRSKRPAYWKRAADLITERGGHWPAGVKEAVCLDKLIAWAKLREPDNSEKFLFDFLDGAWALLGDKVMGLTRSERAFWSGKPYTPSWLLSQAIAICAVLEKVSANNREPTAEETRLLTMGIK